MRIHIENDLVELEPETEEESEGLACLSRTFQSAVHGRRRLVPQTEYVECQENKVSILLRDA
jgi:hypothetical protein